MIHIPVRHISIHASEEFNNYLASLKQIAIYAKAANQLDIFNEAKNIHDNMVRQFNEQNRPKKSFWQEFKDNLLFNMDVESFTPENYLDLDDPVNVVIYEYAKSFSPRDIQALLSATIKKHNDKYGK